MANDGGSQVYSDGGVLHFFQALFPKHNDTDGVDDQGSGPTGSILFFQSIIFFTLKSLKKAFSQPFNQCNFLYQESIGFMLVR